MSCRVVFTPEAADQLVALYDYIAAAASPDIAARYTEAIIGYCESLQDFPTEAFSVTTYGQVCGSPTTANDRFRCER